MNFLSPNQKKSLELSHSVERDGRIKDRIKAVLLYDEGWTQVQISQALRIRPETVSTHIRNYRTSNKLKPENGGSSNTLSKKQAIQVIEYVENNLCAYSSIVCNFVKKNFCIEFSVSGMRKWLHRFGFSYKKPKMTPYKADLLRQNEFIKKYEQILNTMLDNDSLVFIDSVHPTMATKVSHGWIRTGFNKPIATTASRTRVNISGALNLETMDVISEEYERINGATTVEFLKKIEAHYPRSREIHVVLDQSGYHKSLEVREYAKNSRIKLHYLPPYSPNLNPIERVWKVMNEKVRNNRFFHSAKEFRKSINDFFAITWNEIAHTLIDRINDNFETLK